MASTALRESIVPALAFLVGAGYFVATFGVGPLDPWNLDWLVADDKAQHLSGWLFFTREPWQWPIGRIEGIVPPIGTSIVFTDSIPLLAIPTKLLIGGQPVQYFGLWLVLCFGLQAMFGALLVRTVRASWPAQLLSGAFFVLSPVLIFRTLHAALCAHWLILAAIWLVVRSTGTGSPVGWFHWSMLLGLAITIHPYLAAMVGVIAFTDVFSHLRHRWDLLKLPAMVFLPGACGIVLGLGSRPASAGGFSDYTADLLTFVNPMGFNLGFQSWIPSFQTGKFQYEGYGYLGLGAAVLAIVAAWGILRAGRRLPFRAFLPIAMASLAMLLFALSPKVTAAGATLVESEWALRLLEPVGGVFRSSGRFIWPAYYLTMTAIVLLIARLLPGWQAGLALIAGLSFQLADTQPLRHESRVRLLWTYQTELRSPEWSRLGEQFRHLALVPPRVPGAECREDEDDWQQLLLMMTVAARQQLTINSAYLARAPVEQARRLCEQAMSALERGTLDSGTVYLVSPRYLDAVRQWTNGTVNCRELDDFTLCRKASSR